MKHINLYPHLVDQNVMQYKGKYLALAIDQSWLQDIIQIPRYTHVNKALLEKIFKGRLGGSGS